MSVVSYHRLPNLVTNQSLDRILLPKGTICKLSNLIFVNTYENMRNKSNMEEKYRGVRKTLPKCQLLTTLDYQTCYQIKVETKQLSPIV